MEENKITTHLVKGLIIGLILIVLTVAVQFLGIKRDSWPIQVLSTCIFIGGIIWSCWYYGKQKNNYVTFGNLFGHGFKTTTVIAVVVIIFMIIFLLIFPEIKTEALEQARKKAEDMGNQSDEQIEKGMDIYSRMFLPITIGFLLLGYAFIGAIASLIGAAITKKKPVTPFDGQ